MAFKVVNDIVIKNDTNINVDGMDVLVGDGDPNTKVLLQNVQLTTNVLSDSNLTTDNLTEGTTNLYFNDLRAQAALAGDIATLQADIANAIVTANSYTDSAVSVGTGSLTTDDVPEGANLYYTDARVDARIPTTLSSFANDSNFATIAYTDQSELDAKLYTDAREIAITSAYTSAIAAASSAGSSGSNAYTDQEVANAITTMTLYTDQEVANAITTMTAYTDQAELDAVTTANAYTDTAKASAISTSNLYTDNALTNAIIKDVSSSQHWVDLGANTALYWGTSDTNITGNSGTIDMKPNGSSVASFETTGLVVDLLKDIRYQKNNNVYTKLKFRGTVNSSDHTIYIPDASGDMALTSDLPASTDDLPEGNNRLYYEEGRVQYYLATNGWAHSTSVATADQAVEAAANTYTDNEVATALASANTYTDSQVANLVDSAPAVLDTLNELAAALGDDPNFATTISNDIGTKVSKSGDTMTGDLTLAGAPTSANHAATKSYVDSAVASGTGALDTDVIPEGASNLYYTDARVDARIPTNVSAFTNDSNYALTSQLFSGSYSDLTNTPTNISAFINDENYIAKETSGPQEWVDLGAGTALYWGTSDTNITGNSGTIDMKPNGSGVASFEPTGLVIDLLKDIRYQKNNNVYTTLSFEGTVNSSDHTITIPDATGTIALTSDLTNLVTQTSLEQHLGDSSVDGTIGNTVYHRILTSKNDAIAAASADATIKLNNAESNAKTYTDTKIAELPTVPVNVSAFNNDSNYSTFTSNQGTDTTDSVTFKSIEINTNNQTSETDLILNANSVIGGNNSINMALTDTGGAFRWWIGTTDHATGTSGGSTYMTLNSTELSVTGEIVASGDVCAYSDRRLKRNIETIDNALDKVNNLRGVTFEKGLQPSLGVIAQEVEEVLPELVKTDTDGMKSVAYGNMVGLLIEAIKEQQKQIQELKSKIENK